MKTTIKAAAITGITALALAGCGNGSRFASEPAATDSPRPTITITATPEAEATATATPKGKTAAEIARTLKARIPSIKGVTVWTAELDPNHLLGRPGGYVSAATVTDKRVVCSDPLPGADCGASVETFRTAAEAKARSAYIQGVLKASGGLLGTEYDTVRGTVLLRVTGRLTPKQAKAYASALPR